MRAALVAVQLISTLACVLAVWVNMRQYKRWERDALDAMQRAHELGAISVALADRIVIEHGCDVCRGQLDDGDTAMIRRGPDGVIVAHAMCLPPLPTEPLRH